MNRIVLVDGENLTYGLRHLLGKDGVKAPRSMLNEYNFRGLIEELLIDEIPKNILWFGARLRLYDMTPELKIKSHTAILHQAKFTNQMQQQKIQFIKVGYLRAREYDPCPNCEHQEWHLAEKGVDVGLAVRILTEANPDNEIVVISADTDLLPALKGAKKLGAKLMHIGYEHRPINAMSQAVDATRLITQPIAHKYLAK